MNNLYKYRVKEKKNILIPMFIANFANIYVQLYILLSIINISIVQLIKLYQSNLTILTIITTSYYYYYYFFIYKTTIIILKLVNLFRIFILHLNCINLIEIINREKNNF